MTKIDKILNNIFIFIFCFIILFTNINNAKEILIYADNISYDEEDNIIARGNAKIIQDSQLITSDLIIYEKKNKKIILPTSFIIKDKNNNYFMGSSGFVNENFNNAEFKDPKIKLNDGSRIIGNFLKRNDEIDIISKGVYSPCKSKIKIANFICPTWQLEGEKILHDNKNLFLHQKHSKMRIINTPVFYIPYIVTPSPLRKERKSGFLSPTISLNFFDTKTSQSIGLPYYFNIDIDKELTFIPSINYGGGVDSSQRFVFDYNQIISGGEFSSDLTFDSNFEVKNNNKWLKDASLITNYKKNLNKNYKISAESALQTSKNYIQITNPNDDLSYKNSLSTNVTLEGFYLNRIDDYFKVSLNYYQTNQENEDNKTIPLVLPNIQYFTGTSKRFGFNKDETVEFYNILRDKNTNIHAQNQQKLSHKYKLNKKLISKYTKFSIDTEIYNQTYNTENKFISEGHYHSGSYYRFFPILGISAETPFKIINFNENFTYKPNIKLIITPGISNSNKLSNEDSTNNNFTINNINSLSRYSGNDKMDNSKRLSYGISMYNEYLNIDVSQYYEFTNNSNYHIEQGNNDHLSDLLGSVNYKKINKLNYNFRYDVNEKYLKNQNINFTILNNIGKSKISYLDKRSKNDNIITKDTETINYGFESKKFLKFSKINFNGLYDLQKEINTEYNIGYSYFDECFGINLDFNRKSYSEDNLKPQDILTIMFSFKNLGSYKSTNLAVSENDKQEIEWENITLNNNLFENYD